MDVVLLYLYAVKECAHPFTRDQKYSGIIIAGDVATSAVASASASAIVCHCHCFCILLL